MKQLFFRMLWEDRRAFFITLLSDIIIIAIFFFSLSVGSGLLYVTEQRDATATVLLIRAENNFLVPYILLTFLHILVLLDYMRKRSSDYAKLAVFGIKKKFRTLFIAAEYLGLSIGSLVGGVVAGGVASAILKPFLENIFHDATDQIDYGMAPLRLILIIWFILFGAGFMVCEEMVSCLGMEYVISGGEGGKRGVEYFKKKPVAFASIAAVIFILLITYWGEVGYVVSSIFAAVVLGIALFFWFGIYLGQIREKPEIYFKKIFWMDAWYTHFRQHLNKVLIISVFLMLMLFGFNMTAVDNLPITQPENYPFDMVWFANQGDEKFLEDLEKRYQIQYQMIPCIRVSSGDHGEHMGISQSEYKKWTGDTVELSDKEIYIIYQSDRAEKGKERIESGNLMPYLYIGSAEMDLWTLIGYSPYVIRTNHFQREYQVSGSEEKILTGNFKSRAGIEKWDCDTFDAVIVFSDQEYKRISPTARGANLAVLMNIPESYDEVTKAVYDYAKDHSQVNFYDYKGGNLIYEKKDMLIEDRQEKGCQLCASVMNMGILLMCVLTILMDAYENEYKKREWKYRFWCQMGMSEKKRKKNLKRDILLTVKLGIISGIPFGYLLMAAAVLHKDMTSYWSILYLLEGVLLSLVVSGILLCIMNAIACRNYQILDKDRKNGGDSV